MKFYCNNKFLGLFLILLITFSHIDHVKSMRSLNTMINQANYNPGEIVEMNAMTEHDKRVEIDLSEGDPLEYMKRKEELINLYLKGGEKRRLRFKQIPSNEDAKKAKEEEEKKNQIFLTKPNLVSKMGDPTNKEYHNEEEVVKIKYVQANSYADNKNNDNFVPKNILLDDGKFWCSEGNHDLDDSVRFQVEFDKSYRLSAFWIHWAFAPGQYKVSYSNTKETDGTIKWIELIKWKDSVKGGDTNWWKSIIANPKTRWKYKSFDERVNMDEPTWARYILIDMRLPVNQYFGIYKLEFYIQAKAVVMLKSRKPGEELCLTVANGQISNNSPVLMIDCLQGISYGDNRDLFVLHSNGFITTYKDSKCLQSPTATKVDVLDCGKSSDFKDEREKWILEHDGKIRSVKEEFTCLAVTDFSIKDDISHDDLKTTASSTQNDGIHGPEKVLGDDLNTYWASNPTLNEVILEIFFFKYPYILKEINIDWKFPAKAFNVIGLYPDGYWRIFKKMSNNRETSTNVNFKNKDLMGIRITMTESSTKIEEKNVYGIKNVALHTGGRYLRRDACKNLLLDSNKFEIIDVTILDQVTGFEFKKSKAALHKTRTKLRLIEGLYKKVPDTLLVLKETSANLSEKLHSITERFVDMQLKLTKYEDFLHSEEIKIFTIATSEHFPANDCAHIIKAFPSKRSGMYWIKNECMANALQVYCDFDSYDRKGGLDYYIFNDSQPVNTPFTKRFRNHNDIRYKCYELGLEPLEIKNEKMLKTLYYLLKINNYNLSTDYIIPIAYDYNCEISKCSKIFKSLGDINSGDISDMINNFNDEMGNNINSLFSSLTTMDSTNRNVAAFGKIGNIVYQKLSTSKVSAIMCSTNKDGSKEKKNFIDIDCDTNLRSDEFAATEIFSILRMNCPADCAKMKTAIVYGSDLYTDNSSVCRAAVHSGAKKDNQEGVVEVHFEPGKDKYLGVDRFNINSQDYADKWNRSFTVKKYTPYCPVDKLKEYNPNDDEGHESFLELGNSVTFENTNTNLLEEKKKEIELVNKIKDVISNYEYLVSQDSSIQNNKKSFEVVEQLGQISRFLQSDITHKDTILHSEKNQTGPGYLNKMRLMNTHNNASINSANNVNTNLFLNSNNDSGSESQILANLLARTQDQMNSRNDADRIKNFLGFELPVSHPTTEIALTFVSALFSNEKNQLSEIKNVSDDFKGIIGKTTYEIEKLNNDKDLGVSAQQNKFGDFESKTAMIMKIIYEIDRKIQNKLKQTEFRVKEARDKINLFDLRESFTEDYNSQSLDENWDTYASKKGKGIPPEWSYFQYFINGHYKVIQQKGGYMDNKSGAHLILKNKDFYDFELKCSFMLRDNQTFGIAFRYKDPYNYYIFEVSNQEGGVKRLRKFEKGEPKLIEYKNDGGFMQETWYNVKIRAQQSLFYVYMTDYNGPDLDSHYELQFTFVDNGLVHGTVAFTSMGMSYLLLDNISVVSIECTNFDEGKDSKAVTLTPTCSRFRETFRNGFNYRWKTIDPLESMEGPSIWKIVSDFADREIVLTQQSLIQGTNEYQEGTIFLLNDPSKVCTNGRFIVKMKALDEGIVGLVFRYDTDANAVSSYYILEVSGVPGDQFIRLRKKIGNKFELISINPSFGYKTNEWFKIILTIENDKFNAFITENSSQDNIVKVFAEGAADNDLKIGLMGITSYKTKLIVDDIILSPFDNLDTPDDEDDLLYVDEEELELPKNKLKEKSIFDRVNTHIKNFSWSKCLIYPVNDDRKKYCNVLFSSKVEIDVCKKNFCDSCCSKMVDSTNKEHNFLCNKQCQIAEVGTKRNTWESCVESQNPETSIYPYCDKQFPSDFFNKQRCKTDMCNLCCISMDHRTTPLLTDDSVNRCYSKCAKTFNIKPAQLIS